MTDAQRQVLLIEWAGASSEDLQPRLHEKQLPTLEALARLGRSDTLTTLSCGAWPWPDGFAGLERNGTRVFTRGWDDRSNADASDVTPAEIEDGVFSFFPPEHDALRESLRVVLARLYTTHNALVTALEQEPVGLIAGRYSIIVDVSAIYAASCRLPQALLAAHRLLDLLLADLQRIAGGNVATLVCCPPQDERTGFAAVYAKSVSAVLLPKLANAALLEAGLHSLLGLANPLAFDPAAAWLQPEFVAAKWSAAPRITGADFGSDSWAARAATEPEHAQLPTLFSDFAWPQQGDTTLLVGRAADTLGGAASLASDNGLTLAFAPGFDLQSEAAHQFVARVLRADSGGRPRSVFLRHPVTDERLRTLLCASGFSIVGTQTLWLATVSAMLERARRLAGRAGDEFQVRPPTLADVALWRGRAEGRPLLRAEVAFDPDLSSAAFRGEIPAGLLIARRLAGRAWVDVMCIAEDSRLAGCFVPMALQALGAGLAAGTSEVVFVTDERSRVARAFARRCGARVLQEGTRLAAELNHP